MSADDNQSVNPSPQQSFNAASQKIVRFDEFESRVKALYKAEMTFRERLLLRTVEEPISMLGAAVDVVRQMFSAKYNQKIRAATGDTTDGIYKGVLDGNVYLNSAIVPTLLENDFSITPKLTKKATDLGLRALDECKDYSDMRKAGLLKPRGLF